MRIARIVQPPELGTAYYHAVSFTLPGSPPFTPEDKDQFLEIASEYAEMAGITIVTYCLMDDHCHLLLQVPPRPKVLPPDEVLLEMIRDTTSPYLFKKLSEELYAALDSGKQNRIHKARERIVSRMWDISRYLSIFKQVYTQWYNRAHRRSGLLWNGRPKTLLVENSPTALATIAAWIDLNPVRAKKATMSARYPWCGYAQAVAGAPAALKGLEIIAKSLGAKTQKPSDLFEKYNPWLHIENCGSGDSADVASKKGSKDQKRNRGRLLRQSARYFLDGGVLGSKEFVERITRDLQKKKQVTKRCKPVRIPGDWEDLHCLHNIRRIPSDSVSPLQNRVETKKTRAKKGQEETDTPSEARSKTRLKRKQAE